MWGDTQHRTQEEGNRHREKERDKRKLIETERKNRPRDRP